MKTVFVALASAVSLAGCLPQPPATESAKISDLKPSTYTQYQINSCGEVGIDKVLIRVSMTELGMPVAEEKVICKDGRTIIPTYRFIKVEGSPHRNPPLGVAVITGRAHSWPK